MTYMTIHHDKLAYGKLASSMEETSEERIAQMLKELADNEQDQNEDGEEDKNHSSTDKKE